MPQDPTKDIHYHETGNRVWFYQGEMVDLILAWARTDEAIENGMQQQIVSIM
jgi:hypothetical protein